jgi:uncharacterized protein
MLFQVGPVTIDTFPFSVDSVEREAEADFATKDLLGRLKGREFVGEGDDKFTLKGKIIPSRQMLNGLPELEMLHGARKAGEALFVMRGDGSAIGWFVIESVKESHEMLGRNGVGQVISHEMKLTRVDGPGGDSAFSLIGSLLSLFG